MGRSAMRCFRQSSGDSFDEHDAFYYSLSEDINQLEQSLSGSSVSLRWSAEAMNMLKKVQVEQLAIIRKSELPISSGAENGWFDQYMHDSIAMLDFCNEIKFAVSTINRHRLMVDVIVRKLSSNGSLHKFSSETIEFEKLEIERQKNLNNLSDRLMRVTAGLGSSVQAEGNGNENRSFTAVMLAAKSAMVVVSLLLVSAIVSPVSIELGGSDLTTKFPHLKPFDEMLSVLICRFHERASAESNGGGLALVEPEIVIGRVMVDLQAQVVEGVEDKVRFMSSVELLRSSSVELRKGIEKFDAAVDDVFEVVMRGRDEMLGVLRDRDLPMTG